MRLPHPKIWLVFLAVIALCVAHAFADINWRDGGNGGPKTGVSGVVNLPSATNLSAIAQWQKNPDWDGWRNNSYAEQLVLKLPSNMPRALVLISHQGNVLLPASVEERVTIDGGALEALVNSGVRKLDLTFMSSTHIMMVRFILTPGSPDFIVLAK